jgi:hypothetical protein
MTKINCFYDAPDGVLLQKRIEPEFLSGMVTVRRKVPGRRLRTPPGDILIRTFQR